MKKGKESRSSKRTRDTKSSAQPSWVYVPIVTIPTPSPLIIKSKDPEVEDMKLAILIGFVTLLVAGAILSVTIGAMI